MMQLIFGVQRRVAAFDAQTRLRFIDSSDALLHSKS